MSVIDAIKTRNITILSVIILTLSMSLFWLPIANAQVTNPQSGTTGLNGVVPAVPPQNPAVISLPTNGQVFEDVPVTVTGICPEGDDLLIRLFKNDVFAGSDLCDNGSFTILIDLFSGTNELVAIVYDALDQAGPESNRVTIEYDDDFGIEGDENRVTITSNFAKRGTDPGDPLIWPVVISGGLAPYALKIDWGDGIEDLISREVAGEFEIDHIYEEAGVYRIIIKITDARNQSSFLQLVGIVNGPLNEAIVGASDDSAAPAGRIIYRWILWPLFLMLVLILITFWLGRRYETKRMQKLIQQQRQNTF